MGFATRTQLSPNWINRSPKPSMVKFDAEIVGALEYHERIVKAISRLRSAINARAPAGPTINETNQPRHAGHATRDCRVALSAEEKRQRLSSNSSCFKCGKQGHIARNCRTAAWLKCDRCSGRHISALCEIWGQRGTDSPKLTAAETQEAATQREKRVTTAPASSTRSSSVLLQTATVWASGNHGRVPVRLLLDTGSQRTFIRKDLSQQLRLSCTGTEEVDVFTLGGSNHPRHYQCRRVNVMLCGRMEPIDVDLEVLEVPEICTVNGPTLEPSVIAMMRDRNPAFADEPQGDQPQDSTISVLIGSDHYWRVVNGRVERFTDTLCAVETIFGWVIQGVCANVNHRLSPRYISATALFLACADNWCTEVLPGYPSDISRLDAIGITDGQDDVSKHPALLHFRASSEEEALKIYRKANAIVADAGMDLRKWCSNSRLLCAQFLKDSLSLENVTGQSSKSKNTPEMTRMQRAADCRTIQWIGRKISGALLMPPDK
ncbi:hypothetical protein MTO96_038369 [Rhipicephalus appendiculatus]